MEINLQGCITTKTRTPMMSIGTAVIGKYVSCIKPHLSFSFVFFLVLSNSYLLSLFFDNQHIQCPKKTNNCNISV